MRTQFTFARGLLYIEGANLYFSRVDQFKKGNDAKRVLDASTNISVLSNFFAQSWKPLTHIPLAISAVLSEWVAYSLVGLARVSEAIPLLELRIKFGLDNRLPDVVVINSITLTELLTLRGNLIHAQSIIDNAGILISGCKYHGEFSKVLALCAKAEVSHQRGFISHAFENFQEATKLQANRGDNRPKKLVSLHGFQFCQVLLDMGLHDEVLKQSQVMIEIANLHGDYRDGILGSVCAGLAYLGHPAGSKIEAEKYLDYAVNTFRQLGEYKELWSYGFLGRAKLYCYTKKFAQAHTDLQEVYEIAQPSGMRLHLTDYHLEMARLLIAESKEPTSTIKNHVDKAEKLINDTGYHRRDKELAELKEQLKILNA